MNNLDTTTPQMRAVKGFMDAFISRDVESIKPLIAKDYTFQTFPKSAGTSDETEAQIQRHGRIMASLTKFEYNLHDVIEAPSKVVIHAAVMCSVDETKLEYDTVCIFSFTEEDGELKILEVKNFMDPQKVGDLYAAVAQARGKGQFAA